MFLSSGCFFYFLMIRRPPRSTRTDTLSLHDALPICSGDTVTKIAGGAADFGVADLGAVLTARARANVPVKAIAINYQYSPHSLFVLKSSGITDFRQVEGKKIGTTPGNSHQVYFPEVAKLAGADPDKITWVNMDGAAMGAQLIAKNIDAAPFYSTHWYYQTKEAKAADRAEASRGGKERVR